MSPALRCSALDCCPHSEAPTQEPPLGSPRSGAPTREPPLGSPLCLSWQRWIVWDPNRVICYVTWPHHELSLAHIHTHTYTLSQADVIANKESPPGEGWGCSSVIFYYDVILVCACACDCTTESRGGTLSVWLVRGLHIISLSVCVFVSVSVCVVCVYSCERMCVRE
jgi:hypothetical protein